MRCPKCNTLIPIGGKVCGNCHFNIYTQAYETVPEPPKPEPSKPAPPKPEPPKPAPPKPAPSKPKAGKWILMIIVALLFCGIGRFAGRMAGNAIAQSWQTRSESSAFRAEASEETVNPAFEALLSDCGLGYVPGISGCPLECFASILEDGTVEILEFGYVGDVVKAQIDSLCMPLNGYSAEQIEQLQADMPAVFEELASYDFVSVKYTTHSNYYIITMFFTDLDDSDNIRILTEAGLVDPDPVTGKPVDGISMEKTTEKFLADGYIQR